MSITIAIAAVRDESALDAPFDPDLAATIHHLHDADDAPLPDAALAACLERELLHTPRPTDLTPMPRRDHSQHGCAFGPASLVNDDTVLMRGANSLRRIW